MTAVPLRYPATRYLADLPADLGSAASRERLSAPALKAFFAIMARWKVRDEDARALLGGVTNGPFYEMKRRNAATCMTVARHWPTSGCTWPTGIRSSVAVRRWPS